jgi:ABC-type amino acid transport substrate-binding protein
VRANDLRFSQYTASSDITLIDLKRYKFGTGTDYKAADELRAAGITPFTFDNPLMPLKQGGVDIIMIDAPMVAYYVQGKGKGKEVTLDDTLRPIGKPMYPGNYVIGFKKNDPKADKLRQEIDQALSSLKQDGTLKRIYQQWGLWNDFQQEIGIIDCS